jgi:hypothetical protein
LVEKRNGTVVLDGMLAVVGTKKQRQKRVQAVNECGTRRDGCFRRVVLKSARYRYRYSLVGSRMLYGLALTGTLANATVGMNRRGTQYHPKRQLQSQSLSVTEATVCTLPVRAQREPGLAYVVRRSKIRYSVLYLVAYSQGSLLVVGAISLPVRYQGTGRLHCHQRLRATPTSAEIYDCKALFILYYVDCTAECSTKDFRRLVRKRRCDTTMTRAP